MVECYRQASDALKSDDDIKSEIYKKMELIESGDKESLMEVKEAAE
uniref:Uncharacterized protein n=1 Tax=uncultured archaeon MedDCM-OCT-S08-C92 TaxID=743100 RepID=D6PC14_9ARCH|nr:hypothetical protein [uncultured archaeon MedDCM-OCT-S08-C92]